MKINTEIQPLPTTASLIEQGYLAPVKLVTAAPAALAHELHCRAAVGAYMQHMPGKRAIVFAHSVAHAGFLAEAFAEAGIAALAVLAGTSNGQRRAAAEAFEKGDILVLITTNVDLSPAKADGVIIATPHGSARRYEHQLLSAMRPRYADGMPRDTDEQRRAAIASSDKPFALILDLAGNYANHPEVAGSVLQTPVGGWKARIQLQLSQQPAHIQQKIAQITGLTLRTGDVSPEQINAFHDALEQLPSAPTMVMTDPMRYHRTPESFTQWMNEHGREGLKYELSVEDFMEAAYSAGYASGRKAALDAAGGGAGEVADLRRQLEEALRAKAALEAAAETANSRITRLCDQITQPSKDAHE